MTERNGVQLEARPISEFAREWEGKVVNGEFQLRQYLGGSDHSAVFLTDYDDQGQTQIAAIKLIPEDSEHSGLELARWELATNLSHRHLVAILQVGRCQLDDIGYLYIVTEYAEENLSEILPNRPLTADEARAMLEPLLDALDHIHGKGLVHGRIKPSNIMAHDDQVKLSVDSLRRIGGLTSRIDSYSSPEARTRGLSPAADVWAFGVILVEAFTQRVPVLDPSGEPVVPGTLPSPFFDIARNCLRKDPRRRWTVSDIVLALRVSAPLHEQKKPVHPKTGLARPNHIAWAFAGALLLAAIASGPKLLRRETNRTRETKAQPTVSESAVKTNESKQNEKQQLAPPAARTIKPAVDQKESAAGTPPWSSVSSEPARGAPIPFHNTAQPNSSAQPTVIQVLPDVPTKARETIRGTVRVKVRVTVDSSGHVKEATLDSPGPSKYFAGLALGAAQRWQFGPAKADGQGVSGEWILRFDFSATDTTAGAVQTGPGEGGLATR